MRKKTAFWYLLIPAVALATVSIAQDAPPDDPSPPPELSAPDVSGPDVSGPVDARTLLGDRAATPDERDASNLPDGVQQGDNAGSLRTTVPAESRSSSTTVTEESSTSMTFGQSDAQFGWGGPGGRVTTLEAGPIWSNNDAKGKCPRTCGNARLTWTGYWKTVGPNRSVCACAGGRGPGNSWGGGGRGGSCSAPANYQCTGCSVSCPSGQAANCTQGDRGIFTGDNDMICSREAKCSCS